jgi:hypothetical protein
MKIRLTKTFSIKTGIDAWITNLDGDEDEKTIDYAGRAGVAWLF